LAPTPVQRDGVNRDAPTNALLTPLNLGANTAALLTLEDGCFMVAARNTLGKTTRTHETMQKHLPLAALALMLCAAPVFAQQGSPHTTPTTVKRVIQYRIKPGHADQFWADLRQHGKPVWDELKRQGVFTDYSVATKSTLESPDDWNVRVAFTLPNWATIDNIGSRFDQVALAHYGSAANRSAAEIARLEHSTVVASFLVRDQILNPWK